MKELATCQNVNVKLGGLGMITNGFDYYKNKTPPTSADWHPWIETRIELFGSERCMFESNFPVDKGMVSYGVLWNAFKKIAASFSKDEKRSLFNKAASRVYRL